MERQRTVVTACGSPLAGLLFMDAAVAQAGQGAAGRPSRRPSSSRKDGAHSLRADIDAAESPPGTAEQGDAAWPVASFRWAVDRATARHHAANRSKKSWRVPAKEKQCPEPGRTYEVMSVLRG